MILLESELLERARAGGTTTVQFQEVIRPCLECDGEMRGLVFDSNTQAFLSCTKNGHVWELPQETLQQVKAQAGMIVAGPS